MEKKHSTLDEMAEKNMIVVDYSDDDIVIIDNINDLTELTPKRLQNNIIAFAKRGKAQLKVNGQTVTIAENQLLLCPPNTMLTDFMFSPGLEFRAIFLTNRIIQSFFREKTNIWNDTMYIYKMHVVTIQEQNTEYLSNVFNAMQILMDAKEGKYPYRSESIRGLLYSAIFGLYGILSTSLPEKEKTVLTQSDSIFQRFLGMLNDNNLISNNVEDYASRLYISPKYLSSVCKKVSGKTAKEWIKEHTMEEIRYYLKETDLSIKEVVGKMGFANASFFCKYVRQNFGMTPMEFRQK